MVDNRVHTSQRKLRLNLHLFFVIVIVTCASLSLLASASVFTYYPLKTGLDPVAPPVTLWDPGDPRVYTVLTSTHTGGNATVIMSNQVQLVHNPDLYSGPDYWYCSLSSTVFSCQWLPSDYGSSGGVGRIYGAVSGITIEQAYFMATVVMPSDAVSSITLNLRAREVGQGYLLHQAALYDPSSNQTVWSSTFNPSTSYSTFSFNIDPSYIEPGKTYYLLIGATVISVFSTSELDFRLDSAYLQVVTSHYTYTGIIMHINNTDTNTYYARLRYISGLLSSDVDCNVTLLDSSLKSSTPIRIASGTLVAGETSTVELNTGIPGYSSGYINISARKGLEENSTLRLAFDYCTSPDMATCTTYIITLVLDPPSNTVNLSGQQHYASWTSREPVIPGLYIERLKPVAPGWLG